MQRLRCHPVTAEKFDPVAQGPAPEFNKFLEDGYSSIRDGVPGTDPHAKKVVVVGWCGDIQDLVSSLNLFAPQKTVVTVLCDCCPEVQSRPMFAIECKINELCSAKPWQASYACSSMQQSCVGYHISRRLP